MPILINDIYQYVFGEWQEIKVTTKSITEEKAYEVTRKRREEAKKKSGFDVIEKNNLSNIFRKTLRDLSSKFEITLYGENTSQLDKDYSSHFFKGKKKEYQFPLDANIKQKFEDLNAQYNYFDKAQEDNFLKFFKVSKLIADFIEDNNDINNEVAYLHAYKMLVLFGTTKQKLFENVDKYLQAHNFLNAKQPLHDALLDDIPVNPRLPEKPLNLEQWQLIIQKGGPKVVKLFQRAPVIEKELGRAPKDFEEAREVSMRLRYKRFTEYRELAELCEPYFISEENFNKSLMVQRKIKKTDDIPNIVIDGATVNHDGYYLVKLPIDDPRAYILGKITNCCQSIGGDSEKCVIDGLTRKNNGFYVLLKRKAKSTSQSPKHDDGRVNYKDFDIVGTGYAWLSKMGNLTIDSWENLRPETDDLIVCPMLKKFAQTATEQSKQILRVTIGKGGKTPKELTKDLIDNPEKMKEGYQYHDSTKQALLYINKVKLKKMQHTLAMNANTIASVLSISEEQIKNVIDNLYSVRQFELMEKLLLQSNSHQMWSKLFADQQTHDQFIKSINEFPMEILDGIFFLHQRNILNESNLALILSKPLYANDMATLLCEMDQMSIMKEKNISLLLGKNKYANEIFEALSELKTEERELLENPENIFQSLALNAQFAEYISFVFSELNEAALLTSDNINLVLKNPEYADRIYEALYNLNEEKILTDDFFKIITTNLDHAVTFSKGLSALKKADLLTEKNQDIIIKNVPYANKFAIALTALNDKNLLDKYQEIIINNIPYADGIALAFISFENDGLLTERYQEIILKNAPYASNISKAFIVLNEAGILEENYLLIVENVEYASELGIALASLKKEGLLTENFQGIILKNVPDASSLSSAFIKLTKANLLENYQAIILNNTKYADSLSDAFIRFHKVGSEELCNLIIQNIQQKVDVNKLADIFGDLLSETNAKLVLMSILKNDSNKIENALKRLNKKQLANDRILESLLAEQKEIEKWASVLARLDGLNDVDYNILIGDETKRTIIILLYESFRSRLRGFKYDLDESEKSTLFELVSCIIKSNYPSFILEAINKLHDQNHELRTIITRNFAETDEIYKLIIKHSENATHLTSAIIKLWDAGLLNRSDENNKKYFGVLEANASQAEEAANALIKLSNDKIETTDKFLSAIASSPSIQDTVDVVSQNLKNYDYIYYSEQKYKYSPREEILDSLLKIHEGLNEDDCKEWYKNLNEDLSRLDKIFYKEDRINFIKIVANDPECRNQIDTLCELLIKINKDQKEYTQITKLKQEIIEAFKNKQINDPSYQIELNKLSSFLSKVRTVDYQKREKLNELIMNAFKNKKLFENQNISRLIDNIASINSYLEKRRKQKKYSRTMLGYKKETKIGAAESLIDLIISEINNLTTNKECTNLNTFFQKNPEKRELFKALETGRLKGAANEAIQYFKSGMSKK